MKKNNEDPSIHNGVKHEEITFPHYRQLAKDNYYKFLSATEFVNIMYLPDKGVYIASRCAKMDPMTWPQFINQSEEITANQWSSLSHAVLKAITDFA